MTVEAAHCQQEHYQQPCQQQHYQQHCPQWYLSTAVSRVALSTALSTVVLSTALSTVAPSTALLLVEHFRPQSGYRAIQHFLLLIACPFDCNRNICADSFLRQLSLWSTRSRQSVKLSVQRDDRVTMSVGPDYQHSWLLFSSCAGTMAADHV